jgi:hypothetical protein
MKTIGSHTPSIAASPQPYQTKVWQRFFIAGLAIVTPNALLGIAADFIYLQSLREAGLWASINLLLIALLWLIQRFLLAPLSRITGLLHEVLNTLAAESPRAKSGDLLNIRHMVGDMMRFATLAQEYYFKHQEASRALIEARQTVAAMALQQQTILSHSNRIMIEQYQSVLAYANYLEEHIERQAADTTLRYDFDDVCESGFTLKLLAGAFSLLAQPAISTPQPVNLASVMQQSMLALASSLDRRSMKLNSAAVDMAVVANIDSTSLSHVMWMILLGAIRYAADESTLTLACTHSADGTSAQLSITVSELAPGLVSPEERTAHLTRQLEESSPHLFASALTQHSNLQIAELLLARAGATIAVLPLSSYACEIIITLPSAE